MFKNSRAFSGYSVDNINKAKEFYSEILGLQTAGVPGMKQLFNLEINGGNKIMLYEKPNHVPATFTVLNFPVDDLEKTFRELNNKGVKFEIYNEENLKTDERGILEDMGMKIAWFKDPAGNILSVLEDGK